MDSYGGRNNEKREGNFDKEGTLASEKAAHNHDQSSYDRMMDEAPDQTTGKFQLPKVTPYERKGKR